MTVAKKMEIFIGLFKNLCETYKIALLLKHALTEDKMQQVAQQKTKEKLIK